MFESDTNDGHGGVDARKAVREERLFRGDDFGVRSVFVRAGRQSEFAAVPTQRGGDDSVRVIY